MIRGFLYREFYLKRWSIVVIAVVQVLATFINIFAKRADESEMFISFLNLMYNFFWLVLCQVGVCELGSGDEKKNIRVFCLSLPSNAKGYVLSKYLFVLATGIAVSIFSCIAFLWGVKESVYSVGLFIMFVIFIIYNSIELPFVLCYGSENGVKVKMMMVTVVFFLACIYGLFGDISPFLDGSISEVLYKLITNIDKPHIIIGIGAVTLLIYGISFAISVLVCRKGVENIEV